MEIRKPNQKLEMKQAPKDSMAILHDKFEKLDKKLDKVISLLRVKKVD